MTDLVTDGTTTDGTDPQCHRSRPDGSGDHRPNVVLLFMDDQTWWALGALGVQPIETPNLDRLVAEGTTFTHAFNQGGWMPAVCTPARAMMLTGRTLFHAQRATAGDRLDPAVVPLGAAFRRNGYRTYFSGKWHNPADILDVSYDEHEALQAGMLPPRPEIAWDPADPACGGHWTTMPDGSVAHSSVRWTDTALRMLDDHRVRHGEQPFFLHVAYNAPHDPRQAPQRWVDHYRAAPPPVPDNFLPEHPFDQGDHLIRDELLAPFPRTPERIQRERAEYFAIVSHVDEQIGRLLDWLDDQGLSESTVVCFSGDHGLALGEHGLLGKQSLYDHSVRVPLIFRGPGVRRGVRRDDLVHQASLHPTLVSLAGLAPSPGIEFSDLSDHLAGAPAVEQTDDEDGLFLAYRDFQRGLRTRRWALLHYATAEVSQLFDMEADPWQTTNLIDDPGLQDVVDRLQARLIRYQAELGDPCGAWVSETVVRASPTRPNPSGPTAV